MILELDSNRALFVARPRAPKKRSGEGRKAPELDTRRITKIFIR